MKKIAIINGRLWDGKAFSFDDVLIENGIISKIGRIDVSDAEFVYDASGKTVTPGLVDIHMHMKGISSDEWGTDAQLSTIPFGVTAAADAGACNGDKNLLDAFSVKNTVFVYAHIKDNKADFTETEKMISKFGSKVTGVKVCYDIYSDQKIKDIKPLAEICEFAHDKNMNVTVHSSNSPVPMNELLETLGRGDILTHAYHGGKNNVSEDDFECIKKAKKRGVIIDTGFAGNVHTDFKIFADAIACGAKPDVISTDITKLSAYTRGGRYGMTMCMSIARHFGMPEEEIFAAVTSNAAGALKRETDWGYLKVGRCGDVAVLDYVKEPFDLTDKAGNNITGEMGYKCILTVSDGKIVYKD